ncbi:hypothetical protein WMF31_11115 [Sorangium sp. So ce1036]|uniref:hypothetical protein n=1 Tax=Sorangium sp. So ce1036 TaxID=3133328 RepID=UPI003F037065
MQKGASGDPEIDGGIFPILPRLRDPLGEPDDVAEARTLRRPKETPMSDAHQPNRDLAALWNDASGRIWVEMRECSMTCWRRSRRRSWTAHVGAPRRRRAGRTRAPGRAPGATRAPGAARENQSG